MSKITTLGEYIKRLRKSLDIDIESFAKKIGIPKVFLENLENGQYIDLPADVYVYGHIRTIAKYLQADEQLLINQYKKEKSLYYKPNRVSFKNASRLHHTLITPKSLIIALITIPLLVFFIYIVYQVVKLNKAPKLIISSPQNNEVIIGHQVLIKGSTDPGVELQINNQSIPVSLNGTFEATVDLASGKSSLTFNAKNHLNNTTTKTQEILINGTTENPPFTITLKSKTSQKIFIYKDGSNSELDLTTPKQITIKNSATIIAPEIDLIEIYYQDTSLGTLKEVYKELQKPYITLQDINTLLGKTKAILVR